MDISPIGGMVPPSHAYLAQSVELSAVNRSVVGSSPTVGASWPIGEVA